MFPHSPDFYLFWGIVAIFFSAFNEWSALLYSKSLQTPCSPDIYKSGFTSVREIDITLWFALVTPIDLPFSEKFVNFRLLKIFNICFFFNGNDQIWFQDPLIHVDQGYHTYLYGQNSYFPSTNESVLISSLIITKIHACARLCSVVVNGICEWIFSQW